MLNNLIKHIHPNKNETDPEQDDTRISKAVAMSCLFTISFIFGITSIFLNKWFKWNADPNHNAIVRLLLGFGGGVLLCTTFLHLLPEVSETFAELEIETSVEMHWAEFLMCTGFLIMYCLEEAIHLYIHRKKEKIVYTPDIERNKPDHHIGHSHIIVEESGSGTIKALRGLLIVLALSVHELFEGLAVGLETYSGHVWYMFGAVSAHKFVIAFCVGIELVAAGLKQNLIILYVFTFAVVSPMGIGIGMAVTDLSGSNTTMISGILQGLASGTLLYVVFFEILTDDRKTGLKQFLSVLFGFVLMLCITLIH